MAEEDFETLNPMWRLLFKVNMVFLPLLMTAVMTWGIWTTKSIYDLRAFQSTGDRFTAQDGMVMELSVKEWMRNNYPSTEVKEDLKEIKQHLEKLTLALAKEGIPTE